MKKDNPFEKRDAAGNLISDGIQEAKQQVEYWGGYVNLEKGEVIFYDRVPPQAVPAIQYVINHFNQRQ